METSVLLERLCGINAAAGFEKTASNEIREIFAPLCDKVWVDSFYNVIGYKKGAENQGESIMVTAHYDQVGMIVTGIEKNGFLRISNIGGIDTKSLLAAEVTVHGKEDLFGVIGAKPPHLFSKKETEKPIKITGLFIDTGLNEDVLREKISIGDPVTIRSPFIKMRNGCFCGRSLDNRCGVAALVLLMEKLQQSPHANDIYVVATVQEETGLLGAISSAYELEPDVAIVIDVCHGDMPEADKELTFPLGKGVPVGIGPAFHKKKTQDLLKTAKKEDIPVQRCVEPGDPGTEAWAIQVSRMGIATLEICIPLRYMHTGAELVYGKDIEMASSLVAGYAAGEVGAAQEERNDRDAF